MEKIHFRPIVPQTTPTYDRTNKKFEGTGFGFNKNFYSVQTTKTPLKGLYQAPHNKFTNTVQTPFTSQRFGQGNLQAKQFPFSGANPSLTTKQFYQANGPFSTAIPSLTVQGYGQGNVQANGPFSAGISSLTSQRFGQGNIGTNVPFSSPISLLSSPQFGQENIQSNRPFSAPLSNSFPKNFNGPAYLPPQGYLPPQKNDFLFQ